MDRPTLILASLLKSHIAKMPGMSITNLLFHIFAMLLILQPFDLLTACHNYFLSFKTVLLAVSTPL